MFRRRYRSGRPLTRRLPLPQELYGSLQGIQRWVEISHVCDCSQCSRIDAVWSGQVVVICCESRIESQPRMNRIPVLRV